MSSLNQVTLIGNLGKDPEVKVMQSGDKVCNLSIATSESWKDKSSGERKEKTEWHRVVVWNQNAASFADKYLRKGSKIYIQGSLETRKWADKDGSEKYSTEIVIRNFDGKLIALDKFGASTIAEQDKIDDSQPDIKPDIANLEDEIPF